jgi:hypothetical protein
MLRKVAFPCPSCLARIKAPIELIGRRRQCPGCGHKLVVYDPDAEPERTELIYMPDAEPIMSDAEPMLITESETVDMVVEQGIQDEPDLVQRLEELETENARLKRLLSEFAHLIGQNNPQVGSRSA